MITFAEQVHDGRPAVVAKDAEGSIVAVIRRTSRAGEEGKGRVYGYTVETDDGALTAAGELVTLKEAKARVERHVAAPAPDGGDQRTEEEVRAIEEQPEPKAQPKAKAKAPRAPRGTRGGRPGKGETVGENPPTPEPDLAARGKALIEAGEEAEAERRKRSRSLTKTGERKTRDGTPVFHLFDDFGMDKFAMGRKWAIEREMPVTAGRKYGLRKAQRADIERLLADRTALVTVDEARALLGAVFSPLDQARIAGDEEGTSIQLWHAQRNRTRAEGYAQAIEDAAAGRPIRRVEPGF